MSVFLGWLHPNTVSTSFQTSLLGLLQHDAGRNILNFGDVRSSGYGLPEARNFIASQVMATPNAEWLLFIDADMGFQPDALDRLLAVADPVERPIVGGLCFVWKDSQSDGYGGIRSEPMPTIYDFIDGDFKGRAHYPANTVLPVAATGTAFLLIHRTVLEKVYDKFGQEWFTRAPRPKGGLMGEDISFFARCGSLEIPAFVHTGVRTTHHKEMFVAEQDFWESFHAPPAPERCDVIVPTVKARTANLEPLLQSLVASTGLATPYVVCDPDADEQKRLTEQYGGIVVEAPGSFARKINKAYPETTAPWVKVVGDDCRFHPGWLDQAQLVARLYGAKVIGSNDLANPRVIAGDHATPYTYR